MKSIILFLIISIVPLYSQYKSVWDKVPESISKTNNFKRYEWFYHSRTDEQGAYPKEFINQQKEKEEQKIALFNKLNKGTGTSDTWTPIGPVGVDMSSSFIPYWGVASGRIRGLDVHPTDPNTAYIGAAGGGIWKTTDGGANWVDKSSGLNRLTFGAISIDPNNTNIVYAGTGESRWLFNNVTFEGDGLYKTTNGGDTWTQLTGIGSTTQFADIEVNPFNSNIILAATGAGNWNLGYPSNYGVWRSSDAGASWTRVVNYDLAFEVAFSPTDANLAYCGIGNEGTNAGFYISTNAGVTWTQSNTGLPSTSLIGRIQFEIAPSSPSTIYSVIYNNSTISGGRTTCAYKSTNSGTSWSQIAVGTLISGTYDGATVSDQGSYDLCLSVNPSDANNVFFGNVEISKTTDGSSIGFVRNPSGYNGGVGAWAGYTHTDIHKIMFAPSNSSIMYVGCDGGIYKSTNSGTSFTHVNNGINTIQFYRIASHPTNASIIYGGAQDNGNFSTSDKGATKWNFETSGDGMECFVDYNNTNNIFMSTQQGSLVRSTDAGVNWSTIKSSISNTAWTAPFWQHPTTPARLFAALGEQIYRSTNSGTSWSAISSSFGAIITTIAQSAVTTSNMMLANSNYTTTPSVYKSTDEGVTWSSVSIGVTGANIQRVEADPVSGTTFYITRASYGTGQVLKTTNLGTSWTDISSNLPAVSANDIFVDPGNVNHLYVANDFGVYWSSNAGTSWTKLTNGMPFVPVLDFDFYNNAGARYLRAATHGRGVYELNIDSPLPVELVSFTASSADYKVILNWSTATENNNTGFAIERSTDNKDFTKVGFVAGAGNSNVKNDYTFTDNNVNGKVKYRLKQIDNNGQYSFSKVVEVDANTIKDFAVYQNYPNPFNPVTMIKFRVPFTSNVNITVTNALGQKLETLVNEQKGSGFYEYSWDGSKYASGIYFYNVTMSSASGEGLFNKTYKMILAK